MLLCGLMSCGTDTLPEASLSGATMGTEFNITIVDPDSIAVMPSNIPQAFEDFNHIYSTYDANSELSKFNQHRSTDWFSTSTELCLSLEAALRIGEMTDGAFDVSVGRLVNLWGFGPGNTILEPPTNDEIVAALETIGYTKLHTRCDDQLVRKDHEDIYVDLSAYAKGLAVDKIAALLDEAGIENYLVELGGEIRARGLNGRRQAWKIAIEKPDDTVRVVEAAIRVADYAVATSGDYRNYFEHAGRRYSHTIDPRTGKPVTHQTASVTVVSDSAGTADAMATALLVMGYERGFRFAAENGIAAFFLVRDRDSLERYMTPAFLPYLTQD